MLFNCFGFPFLPPNCDKPPTLYSIMNSIVNGDKDEDDYTKIKDLSKNARTTIFDFDYPLSNNVPRETFETMILNNYMMRRIGFDTVTAFQIQLNVKLNEIMPIYNKMFDALEDWNIFKDGETTIKEGTDNRVTSDTTKTTNSYTNTTTNNLKNTSTSQSNNTSDQRYSDTPQNEIQEIKNGNYVTEYRYNQDTVNASDTSNAEGSATSDLNGSRTDTTNGTDDNTYKETVTRTQHDKMQIYKDMQNNIRSIYTMIFHDLDDLFYSVL